MDSWISVKLASLFLDVIQLCFIYIFEANQFLRTLPCILFTLWKCNDYFVLGMHLLKLYMFDWGIWRIGQYSFSLLQSNYEGVGFCYIYIYICCISVLFCGDKSFLFPCFSLSWGFCNIFFFVFCLSVLSSTYYYQSHQRPHKLLCDWQGGRGPCCFYWRHTGKFKGCPQAHQLFLLDWIFLR